VQDPFYQTLEWKRLGDFVKSRDGYQCTEVNCKTPERGRGGRLIAGHLRARARFSPFDPSGLDHPSNVRTFCPACDNLWHRDKGQLGER
jgi:hypothetical protein